MQKEAAIALIKCRIIDEQRKHPDLDWQEIAARKIYPALFDFGQPLIVNNTNCNCTSSQCYQMNGAWICATCNNPLANLPTFP